MPGPTYLDGDAVTLRTLEREDLPFCQRHVNDPRVRRGAGTIGPLTAEQESDWYDDVVLNEDHVHLLVCQQSDRLGVVTVRDEPRREGVGEVGYWIAPDARGNGFATDALGVLADHAFAQRRYHKLYGEVAAFNDPSRRVLEKVGFEREGTFREEWYRDGEFVDVYRYGRLAGDSPD